MRGFCVLCAQQISDVVEEDKEEASLGKVKNIVSSVRGVAADDKNYASLLYL